MSQVQVLHRFTATRTVTKHRTLALYRNPMALPLYSHLERYLWGQQFSTIQLEDKEDDPVLRPGASWTRMYLNQPPTQCLTLHSDQEQICPGTGEVPVTRTVIVEFGVTMNDFISQYADMRFYFSGLDLRSSLYLVKKFDRHEKLVEMEQTRDACKLTLEMRRE